LESHIEPFESCLCRYSAFCPLHSALPQNSAFKKISAFDLDKTLLHDNSSFRFGLYLCRKHYLSLRDLTYIIKAHVRHCLGFLSIEALHKEAFKRLFHGRFAPDIHHHVQLFLDQSLDSLLYKPAIEKLKAAKEAGHFLSIVSSAPDFLVEPIAHRLGVSEWYATDYLIDKDQRFCQISRLMLGETKAEVMVQLGHRLGCSREDMAAYSDSHHDLPFLLSAGHAIGVNPNRKLKAICQNNQWPII